MNDRKNFAILAIVFIFLLGGAYLLYDKLAESNVGMQLSAVSSPPASSEDPPSSAAPVCAKP